MGVSLYNAEVSTSGHKSFTVNFQRVLSQSLPRSFIPQLTLLTYGFLFRKQKYCPCFDGYVGRMSERSGIGAKPASEGWFKRTKEFQRVMSL